MKKLGIALIGGLVLSTGISAQVRSGMAANLVANNVHPNGTRPRIVSASAKTEDAAPVAKTSETKARPAANPSQTTASLMTKSVAAANEQALTQTYRVGVGDVLDIQLPNSLNTRSTLYTVSFDGLVDYPLAAGAVPVVGVTTEVIAARLKANIKVLNNPDVKVSVRDYASHTVKVIGFVASPGEKVLRREAVPLYVVLAQATPLADAASVTITRKGSPSIALDLNDPNANNQLIIAGDLIKVSDRNLARSNPSVSVLP
jgi:protein involved in polysaccharide export with SLBB domain